MNPVFATLSTSIFETMSMAARAHGAVNLGQGFPDFGWPEDVVAKAAAALTGAASQYPPMRGLPELRAAVAAHYRRHQGVELEAEQVIVTSGATEAIAAALMALISPGDEVVLFQPLYDAYLPLVLRAGGVPRLIRLTPPGWRITREALAEAFTPATRMVIFNNPHNPTARAFEPGELALLAEACVAADAVALSDEVWEHVLFDGRVHVPLSSLPGMAERTVKIGSAGKIFSLTGWKVGWIAAPLDLAAAVTKAHQFIAFATPPNLQSAVAYGLAKDEAYFTAMRAGFAAARDAMAGALAAAGYRVLPAEGTYFACVDLEASGIAADDATFCDRAVAECGVAAIPLSAFYASDPVTNVIRLCFAKKPETIAAGVAGLVKARALFAGA
ncbi:MAG: N-succinyldiaminopimelate aminotransferase [Sphingomonadales bacterium]|jgi:aspartate/methionine/tyrosine aminotransferase|nr:N-succinyldiaminopimelate aminotransferase [Sphingomonadales bacterium]